MATAPSTERRLVTPPGATGGRTLNGAGAGGAAAEAEAPAAKKSKKKLMIIGGAVLAVVGVAAYMFLAPADKPGPPAEGKTTVLDSQTVNLADGHYLKLTVAIARVLGKDSSEFETSKANELVLEEFSNRAVADVATNEQRDALKKELLANLKKAYKGEIYEIYLTQFVTQ